MNSFPRDYFGQRCHHGHKSSDVFNDFLDIRRRVKCDASKLTWQLRSFATSEDYQSWESYILQGFRRCRRYDAQFDDYDGFVLAHRRVDEEITNCWSTMVGRNGFSAGWESFQLFLRDCFMPPSLLRSSHMASLNVKAIKKPPEK